MEPYYQDADTVLYLGDCREVLPRLEPGSADLLLTDPPYGTSYESGRRGVLPGFGPIAGDDGTLDVTELLALSLDVLRRYRHLYVFGPDVFGALPISGRCELVWAKPGDSGGDMTLPWAPAHERIGFGVYVPERFNRAAGGGNGAARLRRGSVLTAARVDGKASRHPSEKPVPLLRELIETSSRFGETVLDPFAGSGSTLVAAKLEGRKGVGIELEERYCQVAADRLRQQVLPLEAA